MGDAIESLMGWAQTRDPVGELAALRAFESAFALSDQPAKLGRYELHDRIGRGSFGVVVRAYDPDLDRDVAIKVVPGGTADSERLLEARAAARLRHPNVVTVHDAGVLGTAACAALLPKAQGPGVYIVMELLDGVDLATWLADDPRTNEEILTVLLQAGRGLAAAHAAGLVHRDFKPANVVVDPEGRASVLDFGLAVAIADADGGSPNHERCMTAGSPRYMAPEQHHGAPIDARADQYAFCVALYEALVGVPPFAGETMVELVAAKQRQQPGPTPLNQRRHAAVMRGLSYDPADRFETMEMLLARLAPARSRRVTVPAAMLIATSGLAAALAIPTTQAAGDPCLDPDAELEGVWDTDARAAVTATFEKSRLPGAATTLGRIVPRLDTFADAWAEQAQAVCHLRETARGRCLDGQREHVATLVDLLREGDPSALQHAWVATDSLPAPRRCADLDDPTPPTAAPQDSRALARAKVLASAGRRADARAIVESRLEASDPTVVADALDLRCDLDRDDGAPAHRSCLDAALAHEALGSDAAAVARLTDAADSAYREGQQQAGLALFELAEAKAARLGMPAVLRRQLSLAHVLMTDDPAERLERASQASANLQRDDARARLALANIEARALSALGRHEAEIERLEEALALARSTLGDAHPWVASLLNNLGVAERVAGEHARSALRFREALAIKETIGGRDASHNRSTLLNLGRAYLLLGVPEAAKDPLLRARALAEPGTPDREIADQVLLAADWRINPTPSTCSAFEELGRAVASDEAGTYWIEAGLCRLALGDLRGASAMLDSADLDVMSDRVQGRWWLASSSVAFTRGDRATARGCEAKGRALLRAAGNRVDGFDALDGWIESDRAHG